MTIEQFLRDLDEVVELVKRRFHKDKVVLLGHSWGTVLGTIYSFRHPEKVSAYVGVAQISNNLEDARLPCEFATTQTHERADDNALRELQAICPSPRSVDDRLALGRRVERFGGMFHGDLSTGKLIWGALCTDEANLIDLVKFGRGNRFSLNHLESENSRLKLDA
jgi:pimeloyl-ACP methyl ester carboxylesterase